jgi:UDP-galactopyranose mutase
VPFTRIVEHKHFEFGSQPTTWITREYPQITGQNQEPMYPVKDDADQQIWLHYKAMCEQSKYRRYYFGGRLASYQYYDMHQVIGAALDQLTTIEHDLSNFDTHD